MLTKKKKNIQIHHWVTKYNYCILMYHLNTHIIIYTPVTVTAVTVPPPELLDCPVHSPLIPYLSFYLLSNSLMKVTL